MPIVAGKGLVYSQPLYDTIALPIAAAGAVVGTFFQVSFNGLLVGAVNKSYRHTNMVQDGRLETGNELSITAMSLHFPITAEAGALATVADRRAIRSGNLRIVFGGDTEFLKVQTILIPNGGAGEVVVDGTVALNDVQNGVPVAQNKYFLDEALDLHAQESIQVFIENMDAIAAITEVALVLWGTALRPVR